MPARGVGELRGDAAVGGDIFWHAVSSHGALRNLLLYLDAPSPQESAVSPDTLVSLGVLPRLAHALQAGITGAQIAAAEAICKISGGSGGRDMKRLVGEHGCVPLLDAKSPGAREVAAQAVASLAWHPGNVPDSRAPRTRRRSTSTPASGLRSSMASTRA